MVCDFDPAKTVVSPFSTKEFKLPEFADFDDLDR